MARVSVVVPVYNVQDYLDACLESIAAQTMGDLEVILVDDGSTDASGAIADAFATRDARFRVVRRPNGGLSAARNTGVEHATGEFLAFVDSDDLLPPDAYALLLDALDRSGSDFASGNILRVNRWETAQASFVQKAFAETRLKTHVTKFPPLLADRTAWNKLFRRAFWDRHGYRFPEGRLFEDTPVTIPAHFAARSVDVVSDPVYLWRVRADADGSITQKRLELRSLNDRMTAVEDAYAALGRRGRRLYGRSVVADDLRLYLNVLDRADAEYRTVFLDRANAFLDRAGGGVCDRLPAIERLKWHLVRHHAMDELLEVLRFQREELASAPPVRIDGHWYGDYPFRDDQRLAIPRSVYRVDTEFTPTVRIEELRGEDGWLRIRGYAYIGGIGAPTPDAQHLDVRLLRPGPLRRLRLNLVAAKVAVSQSERPGLTTGVHQRPCDPSGAGFEAAIAPGELVRHLGRSAGTWEAYVTVRAGGVKRRRSRFSPAGTVPPRAVETSGPGDVRVRATLTGAGAVTVEVRERWATVLGARVGNGALELSGELRAGVHGELTLRLRSPAGGRVRCPVALEGRGARRAWSARVPIVDLDAAGAGEDPMTWGLALGAPPGREGKGAGPGWITPTLAFEPSPSTWRLGANEVALVGGRDAEALLVVRPPRALLTEARWADEQVLDLAGALPDGLAGARLELVDVDGGGRTAVVDLEDSQTAGRFTAHLDPGSLDTGAGPLPLGEGSWALFTRLDGEPPRPMVMDARLRLAPPRAGSVGYKSFTLGAAEDDQAVLEAGRDLDADERGPYNRRRLERTAYAPARSEALRDAVVYLSFGGRRCSDSPRAIHAELVRRGAALEHVWVVRDGACRAPAGAEVVRDRGREQYEAMARARFVVTNDSLPAWFERREGQVCVQTFNGAPIKRLGRDAADTRTRTRFERSWERQAVNWQYGLSPNRLATPLLRGAYGIAGELLETGHPRVDPLVGGDGAQATRRARRELGVPEDARVVLYAPAVREHVVDRRGRARLDPRLDFPALRAALGPDTVLLFCADARVVDVAPSTGDGMVRDVSASPDASAPLAAADVLITDYSSVMADFANTGRPMLFYTYDLEAYRDRGPGFYLDLEALPGPLLSTAGEVGEALTDLPAVRREHAERYADFRATYCELDDGRATARVVDRLFASW